MIFATFSQDDIIQDPSKLLELSEAWQRFAAWQRFRELVEIGDRGVFFGFFPAGDVGLRTLQL